MPPSHRAAECANRRDEWNLTRAIFPPLANAPDSLKR
jgi:hypothetical protein